MKQPNPRRLGTALLLGLLLGSAGSAIAAPAARDLQSDTWTATDALGRTLPGFAECGAPRSGKYVGVFYFLWLGAHGTNLYDNTKLLAANPENPQYGPQGAFHWWGEPRLGYYRSEDPFVIRKHAQMLSDAGVDVLFFDVTNAFTYDDTVLSLCRVFTEIRQSGRKTPQIAFVTHANSGEVAQRLYDRFYAKNLYPELWFRWQGKPLLLAAPADLSPQLRAFFTLRESWAWSDPRGWFGDGRDKWPWVDNYPQQPGWHDSPDRPEALPVCVAQHPTGNIGRSFHDGKEPPADQVAPAQGLCFAEQWRRALQVDPQLIFVTGWNEWVAQRFLNTGGIHFLGRALKPGETFFVDQYNEEYSRDIEPMRGGHGDNYYYQLVAAIRRFKGVRPCPPPTAPRTIRLNGGFGQWQSVGPEFRDDRGDTAHREHPGWGDLTYTNNSGRNDFDALKVARDAKYLYFYARTVAPLTAPADPCWMTLLLNTDANPRTGWEGYDYILNRHRKNGMALLERNRGGWRWEPVATVKLVTQGNELMCAVPRAALGVSRKKLRLDFKWVDNVPESGDIQDFIDQGDAAPNGRFSYRYEERQQERK